MATLCTVTANSTTLDFKQLSIDTGPRYFIDLIPGTPVYDNKKYRAPGWNGNALIRGGFVSQQLVLIVRYQDTLSNANAAWKADRDLWAQYNCVVNKAIVGEAAWNRCTLVSSDRTSDEMAHGPGGTKFFEVRYVFTAEEQY